MDPSTWIDIVLALMAIISGTVGYLGWREAHSDRATVRNANQVEHILHPMDIRVHSLEQNFEHVTDTIEAAITRAQSPLLERFSSLETKVEYVWEQQKQLALDAARILHQPDPRRAMIDRLLEAFMDGTLSPEEELELRKYLVIIRNWEPGQDAGFPIHPGEQTAAAILLRTMHHHIGDENA